MKRFIVTIVNHEADESVRLEYKSSVDISDLIDELTNAENPPQIIIDIVKY